MGTKRRVNIIFSDNGSGLTRDAVVLRNAVTAIGHTAWLTPLTPRRYPLALNYAPELGRQVLRGATQALVKVVARKTRLWDVNIFLERLLPEYFETAPINCLFPHQEWLTAEDRLRLGDVDLVLFKTKHAMDLLGGETKAAAFVGFTTLDRRDQSLEQTWNAALHVSGWNPHKGTEAVIAAWSSNPQWPELRVVSQLPLPAGEQKNVRRLTTRISDNTLRKLQNECGVHVCPSEVEGFGHTLVEAMSCGAATITTAAPPMNELITPEEGILVPYSSTAPMGAGTRYLVDAVALTDALTRAWSLSLDCRLRMSAAARAKFETMQSSFCRRLATALDGI